MKHVCYWECPDTDTPEHEIHRQIACRAIKQGKSTRKALLEYEEKKRKQIYTQKTPKGIYTRYQTFKTLLQNCTRRYRAKL